MSTLQIDRDLSSGTYFLTFTIFRWYYIFDRYNRWEILSESLKYFQKNKEFRIYGFVFMINHVHLLIESTDVIGFVRDFKKFTSKKIKNNIKLSEPHILKLFINIKGEYQFWQRTNKPVLIESEKFFLQKLAYIENNPVKKDYVMSPEDWYWSSANPQADIKIDPFDI